MQPTIPHTGWRRWRSHYFGAMKFRLENSLSEPTCLHCTPQSQLSAIRRSFTPKLGYRRPWLVRSLKSSCRDLAWALSIRNCSRTHSENVPSIRYPLRAVARIRSFQFSPCLLTESSGSNQELHRYNQRQQSSNEIKEEWRELFLFIAARAGITLRVRAIIRCCFQWFMRRRR